MSSGTEPTEAPAAYVVIADSDVLVRHALSEFLRDCGHRVIEACDSEEVLAILENRTLPVDVLLCSAELGGEVGGFGVRQWVRENRSEVDIEMAGGVTAAANAAATICDQGPKLARPYEPQGVVDRIKWLRARRERNARPQPSETISTSWPATTALSPTRLPIRARASGET